jgi:hypothetical protein
VFLDFRGRIKEHMDVYLDRIDFSEKEERKIGVILFWVHIPEASISPPKILRPHTKLTFRRF